MRDGMVVDAYLARWGPRNQNGNAIHRVPPRGDVTSGGGERHNDASGGRDGHHAEDYFH
jgi:hypothetical protein